MALIVEFICELPNGVHARPASHVETLCNTFSSQIEWHNLRTDRKGNAKSALALIGTDTLVGDNCQLLISGADEQEAYQRLSQWLRDEFPHCDAPLVEVKSDELEPLPVSLTNLNPQIIRARTVCSGSAGGILTPISSLDLNALGNLPAAKGVDAEQSALENGLTLVLKNIEFRLLDSDGATSAILEAHRSLAGDTSLRQHLLAGGVSEGLSCAEAIVASAHHFCEEFARSSSSYLQERALDVRDVCFQLLQQIYGEQRFPAPGKLTQPAICMADELTPSQFLELDKNHLKGLLLKSGGTTSHTVILARSFNIPTLVGVDIDALTPWQHQTIYIDGNAGAIVVEPGEAVARYYQQEARVQDALREQQRVWLTQQARTADGIRIEIAANIAHSVEAQAAFGNGAEGVGLFRTEMLYMDRDSAPDEQEQFEAYQQVLLAAGDKPIIFRTMDIGGDKSIPYLNIPQEENPFLGYRAVRIYPEFAGLFRTQLRAILRAASFGNAQLMIPMVHSLDQILWVKGEIQKAIVELKRDGLRHAETITLGIMVEVPSVCYIIDHFCDEVDFFSIGSNDMTQYLYAVDRNNPRVSPLYNPITPSFLRMLQQIVTTAHQRGKWVGICGELGGESRYLPLLLGLGLDELSMSSPRIPAVKSQLRQLDSEACRELARQACECRSAQEIEALLTAFTPEEDVRPLLALENIFVDQAVSNKEQAIQFLCGNLGVNGRTEHPFELEEDVWQREEIVTTGVGFGVAIPHTKSQWIRHSSISIARLVKPVDWQSEMGEVELVIMLTLGANEGMNHVKVFSQLARKLVNKNFRQSLFAAQDAQSILTLLETELTF